MRRIKVILHITIHDDGARFFEWDVHGAGATEAVVVLKELGEDLRSCPLTVLASRESKLEDEEGE